MVYDHGITVLHEPTNIEVDIVFVHGFTGHPKSTWTLDAAEVKKRAKTRIGRPGGAIFWPHDLLPTTVPTARILTYGYDTKIRHFLQGSISRNTVHDHAWDMLCGLEAQRRSSQEVTRPLVFVAHSLGGVVVRDALKQASRCQDTHPHCHALFLSTISVMFFGTPHRGADPRSGFHRVLSAFAIGIGVNVNKHIMDTLLPTLVRPTDFEEFKVLAWEAKWTVYSFQEETGVWLLFGKKVVEDNSSYLGTPVAETVQHISDNHMDMCRFHGLDDPNYIKVAAAFQRILAANDRRDLRSRLTRSPSDGFLGTSSQGRPPSVHSKATASPFEQPSDVSTQQLQQTSVDEALPNDADLTPSKEPFLDQNLLSAGQPLSACGQEGIIDPMGTLPRTIPASRMKSAVLPSASDTERKMDPRPEDQPQIDLELKEKMVASLGFPELGARMHDIINEIQLQPDHMQTRQWFLAAPEYTNWARGNEGLCDSGFLWIKGKPGTGKSTLMKYLHSIHSRQANCTVISFFFNARGAELEKSTLGCYRTLLFLLLDGRKDLWKAMDHIDKTGPSYIAHNGWNIGLLTDTLRNAVELVAMQQPVECWIDALDECQDSEVQQMVSFFEDLDGVMLCKGLSFRVCFASRHYPNVVAKKAIQIVLENQPGHKNDIAKYIGARLRLGDSIHQPEIQHELLTRSSGIFLWVVLVIPILNREYARGKISALRKRLDEIPSGLDALFHSILTRDREDMQELLRCLQWILCSIRPLKPVELYAAIQLSANPYHSGYPEVVDPRISARATTRDDEMSTDDLRHYVDSVSKGLAEVNGAFTVQFIHESVKDFLSGKGGRSDLLSGMEGFHFRRPGDIHESLKEVCLDHILATYSVIFPDDSSKSLDLSANLSPKVVKRNYPFLRYAVMNVLRHADEAHCRDISQDVFLREFPIHKWTCLYKALGNVTNKEQANYLIEPSDDQDDTDEDVEDFEDEEEYPGLKIFETLPSMLYLLAQFNAHHLLRDYPELRQQFKLRCGGWGYPWVVSIKTHRSGSPALRHLVNAAVENPCSHLTFQEVTALLEGMYNMMLWDNIHPESDAAVAGYLAAFGHGPLLESFLVQVGSRHCECQGNPRSFDTEPHVCPTKVKNILNSRLNHGRPVIFSTRTSEALEVLLAYGADPNIQDEEGGTVVHEALGTRSLEAICAGLVQQVKLKLPCSTCPAAATLENSMSHITGRMDRLSEPLAPRFNINIKNGRGETALSWAVRCDDAIVQLLLDAFPDVDTHQVDNEGRSPLSYAVSHLDSKTIKLLLDHCPESDVQHLNRPDNQGCTVVSYASRKMGDDILRLFLGKFPQIDVDTPDKDGWTPLRWALEGYYKGSALPSWDCMKVLLATRRVNPFHADFRGKSPFVRAQQRIYERKIKLQGEPRDLLLEMIKTAENKEVMSKFQFGDEDLGRIEEEIAKARKMIEEMDLMATGAEASICRKKMLQLVR